MFLHLCERGIYLAPWLDESGHQLLVAVDSHGRRRHSVRLLAADDREAVAEMLLRQLDKLDPVVA